jgi:hypothetical protein
MDTYLGKIILYSRWIIFKILRKVYGILVSIFLSPLPIRVQIAQITIAINPLLKYSTKVKWDAVARPAYSYGMLNAAKLAKALGINEISAIEFGTASGAGLVEMEKAAKLIFRETGVNIEIYGFDLMSGLPETGDYKDQIYFWPPGLFNVTSDKFLKKLKVTKIVMGDVSSTTHSFIEMYKPAKIGFISFDLDYYTSTKQSLGIFNFEELQYLPRVECYMDDTGSFELLSASSHTGVLAAISEFNAHSEKRKILKKEDVGRLRKLPGNWFQASYVAHFFNHDQYNTSVFSDSQQKKLHGQF